MKKVFTLLLTFSFVFSQTLTLKEALELLRERNYEIKSTYSEYKAKKYEFYKEISKRFGRVSLFWNYSEFKFKRVVAPLSPPILPSNIPTDDQVHVYGFRYDVELFNGGRSFFTIKAKQHSAQTAYRFYKKKLKERERDLKKLYFGILALKAKKVALQKRLQEVKKLHEIVKTAYEVGRRPFLDLLNVKAELKNVEAKIKEVNAEIYKLKAQMAVLLDFPSSNFEVAEVKVKPVKLLKEGKNLFTKNPDIKVLEEQRKTLSYYEKASLSAFSPVVEFSYQNSKYSFDSKDIPDWSYTISVKFPLVDFGLRYFNYRRAKELKRVVEYREKLIKRRVEEQYESLVDRLNAQYEVIEANRLELKFAKEAYEIQREKYKLGKADIYDLLKAEELYYSALEAYEASLYRWAQLKAELDYLLGR